MGLERVIVEGLQSLYKAIGSIGTKRDIYVLFTGNKTADTGKSWCPDCVAAEPVIEKALKDLDDAVFVYCHVGDRPTWKDPQNVFRTDPKLRLTGVPTLVKWGTQQRLGPEECAKEDLVRMMFEDH